VSILDGMMVLTAVAALFLAVRGFRSHGNSMNRTAVMALIWLAIIAGLAFVIQRFAA
jgi:Na+-transporting NADH:ubiquinone oxidoreductase subunit NqrB